MRASRLARQSSAKPAPVVAVGSALVLVLGVSACTGSDPDPTVTTAPASGVTASGATLEGTLADLPDEAEYWFEFGPTPDYGNTTTREPIDADGEELSISATIGELSADTTVHFRACASGEATHCGADEQLTTAAAAAITAEPALFPDFNPTVSDYVTRCPDGSVTFTVSAPGGTEVAVGEEPAAQADFTEATPLSVGAATTFVTITSGVTSTYHLRCLPEDFPEWTYERPGEPTARLYVVTPAEVASPTGAAGEYVAVVDDHGVPVWWTEAHAGTDAKVLPDGTIGWGTHDDNIGFNLDSAEGFSSHELDGRVVRTWNTIGIPTDAHEFQMLEDGNVLIGSYPPRPGTQDLSAYGGPAEGGTLIDAEIQEIDVNDDVVWSWSIVDHVDPSETADRWRNEFVYGDPRELDDGRQGYDWAHFNSIHQVGDTILLSFRHLDAVYAIDKPSGEIIWKLGGTETPESLTVLDDPESNPLGGQHDARLQDDGSVTVYDNNTEETDPPRAVRYQLDLEARTATLVEAVSDPDVSISPCCGSAARLADGSWLVSWGGALVVAEYDPDGEPHFVLTFKERPDVYFGFTYRVDAVEHGVGPTLEELRSGMDAMANGS